MHLYSGGMISEFHQLSEKITQLAALADSLRRENGELRQYAATVTAENEELSSRMMEAHRRVSALLEKIPEQVRDEEAA